MFHVLCSPDRPDRPAASRSRRCIPEDIQAQVPRCWLHGLPYTAAGGRHPETIHQRRVVIHFYMLG